MVQELQEMEGPAESQTVIFTCFFLEEEGGNMLFQEAPHCWMQGINLTLNIKKDRQPNSS